MLSDAAEFVFSHSSATVVMRWWKGELQKLGFVRPTVRVNMGELGAGCMLKFV